VTHHLQPLPERRDGPQEDGASTCTLALFVHDIPARAPPSRLLS
jgi:hypothetical protein